MLKQREVICIFIAFGGVVLIASAAKPQDSGAPGLDSASIAAEIVPQETSANGANKLLGLFFALTASFTMAISSVMTRSMQGVSPTVINFWYACISSVYFAFLVAGQSLVNVQDKKITAISADEALLCVALGTLYFLGSQCLTSAY